MATPPSKKVTMSSVQCSQPKNAEAIGDMSDVLATAEATAPNLPSGSYHRSSVYAATTVMRSDQEGRSARPNEIGPHQRPERDRKEHEHADAEEHQYARTEDSLAEGVPVVLLHALLRAPHQRQDEGPGPGRRSAV